LTTILRRAGAQAVAVGSASAALEALRHSTVDVLVSDIGMPEEDGYALIGKVRALAPERGGTIPAIAVTAGARVEDRSRALSAGFQLHVAKPIDPAALTRLVAQTAHRGA
jgi:CheY-like chemotaxis protein